MSVENLDEVEGMFLCVVNFVYIGHRWRCRKNKDHYTLYRS